MYYLYPDIFQKIIEFLDSDTIYNLSITCKSAYKAFKRRSVQEKISFPLKVPKRLTFDQRNTIKSMENSDVPVKLISGGVGSGKTMVSLAYCLRKGYDKIFIAVPPNLITMWKDTCINYFGIAPFIAHTINSKYRPRAIRDVLPTEKIILSSYKIFDRELFFWKDKIKNCILIIDEAHHSLGYRNDITIFKEIIGLSATVLRKNNLQSGIKSLIEDFYSDLTGERIYADNDIIEEITHNLEKTVIAKNLPEVVHMPPYQWKLDINLKEKILGKYNLYDVGKWTLTEISKILTHPFLVYRNDKNYCFLYEYKIGKKTHRIFFGDLRYLSRLEREQALKRGEEYVDNFVNSSVKYKQVLAIYEYLKNRKIGEKILLFDVTVEYIPFIAYFLYKNNVKFFTYSSDYSVTDRQKQLDKFKSCNDTCILISAPSMLGEGHNITEANHVIFLAPQLHEDKYEQTIGRCWRYPQEKQVYIHHLFNSSLEKKYYEYVMGEIELEDIDWHNALSS